MKNLILSFFILCSLSIYSQERLGATYSEIKAEYPSATAQYLSDGTLSIEYVSSLGYVMHFIKPNETYVTYSGLLPDDNLYAIIQYYNDHYVTVNSTTWRKYISGICVQINLKALDDGSMCFHYKVVE